MDLYLPQKANDEARTFEFIFYCGCSIDMQMTPKSDVSLLLPRVEYRVDKVLHYLNVPPVIEWPFYQTVIKQLA